MVDKHIRLRVLKALTEHLEGITVANGYGHDLKGKVYRGRDLFGDNDKPPFLSLLEGKGSEIGNFADENRTTRADQWILLVQGWVVDDKKNPTDPAYNLLADVEQRLSDIIAVDNQGAPKFKGVHNLKGLITSLTMASPVVRPPENGVSSTAFFYLPIRIGLAVDLTKPWQGSKEINR